MATTTTMTMTFLPLDPKSFAVVRDVEECFLSFSLLASFPLMAAASTRPHFPISRDLLLPSKQRLQREEKEMRHKQRPKMKKKKMVMMIKSNCLLIIHRMVIEDVEGCEFCYRPVIVILHSPISSQSPPQPFRCMSILS